MFQALELKTPIDVYVIESLACADFVGIIHCLAAAWLALDLGLPM
jgi:hypothetical protein